MSSSGRITKRISRTLERQLKLRIKGKLGIAFVGFSALPVLVVGTLAWYTIANSMKDSAYRELGHLTELVNIRLHEFTESVFNDLQYISRALTDVDSRNAALTQDDVKALETQVYNILLTRPHYLGVTYLVDSLQSALFSLCRNPFRAAVIRDEPRRYSWNYYKFLVKDLPGDRLQLIPIELMHRSSGNTYAAFSIAIHHRDPEGEITDVLIIDVSAGKIFDLIETTLGGQPSYSAGLVNEAGHYLYHSTLKQNWNRLLAEADTQTLFSEFPGEYADRITDPNPGTFTAPGGEAVAHIPLVLSTSGITNRHFFYLKQPGSVTFAPVWKFSVTFLLLVGVIVAVALWLSQAATKQFIEPLRDLQEGSDIISRGDFTHRLQIQTGDEMQDLAEKFNTMAASVQKRDRQVQEYSSRLELMVDDRARELREERNKLRVILNNVPSAFILIGENNTVLTASEALNELIGYRAEDIVGRHCGDVLGQTGICDHCLLSSSKGERIISQREIDIETSEGQRKRFELVNVPVQLTGGEHAHLEILTDITRRLQLQRQLVQSEKLAAMGEMAGVIAHEIRNSLTSANMLLQLIQESQSLDISAKESLDIVLKSINRINQITTNLLAFARPYELEKISIDVDEITKEVLSLHSHHLQDNNIELQLHIPDGIPQIQADHELMREVFTNILLNACQAVGQNGTVSISAAYKNGTSTRMTHSDLENDTLKVATGEEGGDSTGEVVITFSDTGPGIPEGNLHRIFDPFFTTKARGTGLGLSMVKRVIEAHGGTIHIVSTDGQGAIFNLTLPV